jgi:hypothetical protein
MTTLSSAMTTITMTALLTTQPGCVTRALVGMGEYSNPRSPPIEQPVTYLGAQRDGRKLNLEYDTTLDAEGNRHSRTRAIFPVDLGNLHWQDLGPVPMDPYCTSNMWMRLVPNAPPQPPVPVLSGRRNDIPLVLGMHKHYATGFPPISVHTQGLDTWIVCGAGDFVGYARAPIPPEPHPGSDGTRHPGYIVAIVLLFPFALAVDIVGGVFYVAVCLSGKC